MIVVCWTDIYIWYRYGSHLSRIHLVPKCLGKLRDIDNGDFYQEYKQLRQKAKECNRQAREQETKDKEKAKELFRDAIGYLKQIDDLFENNYDKIGWSVAKGLIMRFVWALGWIISACYFFVRNRDPFKSMLNVVLGWFGLAI